MADSLTSVHWSSACRALLKRAPSLALLLPIAACGGGQSQSQMPTAQTTDEVVTFTVPSVRAVEAGSETQDKKQVIVALIPRPFTVSDKPLKECLKGVEESKGLMGLVNISDGSTPKKPYVVTTRTGMDYEPKTLSFSLRITNRSEKIMRLGDLYLKVNINSQEVEVSKLDLDAIKAGVLLKGEGKDFIVSVPSWNSKSAEATVDFSLQNVPIDVDPKGVVAETGDFSWTFKAQNETKQAKTTKTVENLMLDAAEASTLHCRTGAVAAN
ncbi:MAG: hypothetical protein EOO73_26565 [Myxococcales bacterium]|nr:MAG: hypothetical protein EOO73_26565 [Myxococcales bacterium]